MPDQRHQRHQQQPDDGANSLYQNAEPEEEKRQCNAFVSPQRHAMQQAETKNLEWCVTKTRLLQTRSLLLSSIRVLRLTDPLRSPKVGVPNGSTRSLFSSKQSLGAEGGRSVSVNYYCTVCVLSFFFSLLLQRCPVSGRR